MKKTRPAAILITLVDRLGAVEGVSPTRQPNVYPLRAFELVVVQNWFGDARRLTAEAK